MESLKNMVSRIQTSKIQINKINKIRTSKIQINKVKKTNGSLKKNFKNTMKNTKTKKIIFNIFYIIILQTVFVLLFSTFLALYLLINIMEDYGLQH